MFSLLYPYYHCLQLHITCEMGHGTFTSFVPNRQYLHVEEREPESASDDVDGRRGVLTDGVQDLSRGE